MKIKSTLQLITKLLVILGIPLFIFVYVDQKPAVVETEEDDEGTREIAIVNEDNGATLDDENILLGSEMSALLNEREELVYRWTVVGRRAAEQGFRDRVYDAVLYIPSNFSENIMTFKEENPNRADVNYIVQPYLDAKNRQRVHREMALANNVINENVSTIYWSYVSQEIKNIRDHFDNILEKEIDFQQAMHSFYAPSSKRLADEIRQHQAVLEGILMETSSVADRTSDYYGRSEDAENEMVNFVNALEQYKEAQQTQQQLLEQYLASNEEAIRSGLQNKEEFVEDGFDSISNGYYKQLTMYADFNQSLIGHFNDFDQTMRENKREITLWSDRINRIYNNQERYIQKMLIDFSEDYLNQSFEQNNARAIEELTEAIDQLLEAEEPEEIDYPAAPEIEYDISYRELEKALHDLKGEIEKVKRNLLPKGEDDGYDELWAEVFVKYETAKEELEQLIESDQGREEALKAWKQYARDLDSLYAQLDQAKEQTIQRVNRRISNLHTQVTNFYNRLDEEEYRELIDKFLEVELVADERSLNDLIDYLESLSNHNTVLEQKLNVDRELIEEIIASNEELIENKEKMLAWFSMNEEFEERLKQLLGIAEDEADDGENGDSNESKEEESGIKNLNLIIREAANTLNSYDAYLAEHQEATNQLIDNLLEESKTILTQLRESNAESFEWDESPALAHLDEEIPINIHQGSMLSLDTLADLVGSLNENQENMVLSTSDLQAKVDEVQRESDDLNSRWDQNVATTQLIKDEIYGVLGNTIVDGQYNYYVYNHLANPVQTEGTVQGTVKSESEERFPPVVLLIIILISGLLIGYVSNYYSKVSYWLQGTLFILLNLATGLIISIYSASLYELSDSLSIKWFLLTALLLLVTSNIIRGALFIHTFVGWLASIAMIIFFVTPLINIAVPEFNFNNPIANVYIGLQYNLSTPYVMTIILLTIITLVISLLVYALQMNMNKQKKVDSDEEMAA